MAKDLMAMNAARKLGGSRKGQKLLEKVSKTGLNAKGEKVSALHRRLATRALEQSAKRRTGGRKK